MNKRIEGTFSDYSELKDTINFMMSEGYAASQLMVITRNPEGHRLKEETAVDVVVTSDQEESLWDKIVSFFTVDMDDDDEDEVEEEEIFEDYGIDEDTYERFEDALEEGEYLLLIDDAPPATPEHSEFLVRDGIIKEEEDTMKDDKTPKGATPEWAEGNDRSTENMDQAAKVGGHQAPHPDPTPGETETDHVEHEIPQSQHPDPLVDDDGNEIVEGQEGAEHDAPTNADENPDLEEDTTGAPIDAPDPDGDPTMADENQKMDEMQFDAPTAAPEEDGVDGQVSRDPFGFETEEVAADEGGEEVDPEYDDSDRTPPAL